MYHHVKNDSTGEGEDGETDARGPWNQGDSWKFIDSPAFNGGMDASVGLSKKSSIRRRAKKRSLK